MKKGKVLNKLRTLSEQEMQAWLKNLPDDEMIEATQILKDFAKSSPLYKTDGSFRKQIAQIEANAERFRDSVLNEKVHDLMHEVEVDAQIKKIKGNYDKMRTLLLDEIKRNPKKVEDLKKLAFGMIEIEKEYNDHDPQKWKPLFDM